MDRINLEQKNAALSAALLSPSQNMHQVLTQMIRSVPSSPVSPITSPIIHLPTHSPPTATSHSTPNPADAPNPAHLSQLTPATFQACAEAYSFFDSPPSPQPGTPKPPEKGEVLLVRKTEHENQIIDVVSDGKEETQIPDNVFTQQSDNKVPDANTSLIDIRPVIELDLSSLHSPQNSPVFALPAKIQENVSRGGCSVASLLDKTQHLPQSEIPFTPGPADARFSAPEQIMGDFTCLGLDFDDTQPDAAKAESASSPTLQPMYSPQTQHISEENNHNSKTQTPQKPQSSRRTKSPPSLTIRTRSGRKRESEMTQSMQQLQLLSQNTPMEIPQIPQVGDFTCLGMEFEETQMILSPQKKPKVDSSPDWITPTDIQWDGQDFKFSRLADSQRSEMSCSQFEVPFSQLQNVGSPCGEGEQDDTKPLKNSQPKSQTPHAIQMRGYRMKMRIERNVDKRAKSLKDVKKLLQFCKQEIQRCSDKSRQSTQSDIRNKVREMLLKALHLMANVKRDNLMDQANVDDAGEVSRHYKTCCRDTLTTETTRLTKIYLLHREVVFMLSNLFSGARRARAKRPNKHAVKSEQDKVKHAGKRGDIKKEPEKYKRQAMSVVQGPAITADRPAGNNKRHVKQEANHPSTQPPPVRARNKQARPARIPQAPSQPHRNTADVISSRPLPPNPTSNILQQTTGAQSTQKYRSIAPKPTGSMFTSPALRKEGTVRESQLVVEEFFKEQKKLIEEGRNWLALSQRTANVTPSLQYSLHRAAKREVLETVQLRQSPKSYRNKQPISPKSYPNKQPISAKSPYNKPVVQAPKAQYRNQATQSPQTVLSSRPLPRELARLLLTQPAQLSPTSPSASLDSSPRNDNERQCEKEVRRKQSEKETVPAPAPAPVVYPSPLIKEIKIKNTRLPKTPEQFRARVQAHKALSVLGLVPASPDFRSGDGVRSNISPDATQMYSTQDSTQMCSTQIQCNTQANTQHPTQQHPTQHPTQLTTQNPTQLTPNTSAHNALCTPLSTTTATVDIPSQDNPNIDVIMKFLIQENKLDLGYNAIYTCTTEGARMSASVDSEGYILYKDKLYSTCRDWLGDVFGGAALHSANICNIVYSGKINGTFEEILRPYWDTCTSRAATQTPLNDSGLDTDRDRNAATKFAQSSFGSSEFFDVCTLLESNFEIRMISQDEYMSTSDLDLPPNFWYTESAGVPPAIAAEVNVWPEE